MKEEISTIIESKDLQDVTIDLVESVLDNQITDEVLKEIPVLKSLVAVKNIYSSYTDAMFIKKAMNVLLELKETNWKERVQLTQDLNDEFGTGAEKILMAVERLESIEKCRVFGRLCKLKATKKINLEQFKRLTKLLQDAYLPDLLIIEEFRKLNRFGAEAGNFTEQISLGLIFLKTSDPTPIRRVQGRVRDDYEYVGGEVSIVHELTSLGELLLKHIKNLFPSQSSANE